MDRFEYVQVVNRYGQLSKWLDQIGAMDQNIVNGDTIQINTGEQQYPVDSELLHFMIGMARMDIESEFSALHMRIKKYNSKP